MDVAFQGRVSSQGSSVSVTDPQGRVCTVEGPRPEVARTVALTGDMLAQRLAKTGGTPYRCAEVTTHVEPGYIIPASTINAMRRDVLNQLTALRARHPEDPIRRPKSLPSYPNPKGLPGLNIQVTSREQLTPKLLDSETTMLYVPLHVMTASPRLARQLIQRGRVAAVLPRIIHDKEMASIKAQLLDLYELGLRDVLLGNLGHMIPARECGMRIHGDFGLNIFNTTSMVVLKNLELSSATASFELTLPQIRDLGKAVNTELIAYGRLPLMVLEHCLIRGRTGKCSCQNTAPGTTKLIDKTGAEFPVIKDGDSCRNILLNGKKLNWLDRQNDLAKLGLWSIRLYFTTESPKEVDRILSEYLDPSPFDPGANTRGLYLRGVE